MFVGRLERSASVVSVLRLRSVYLGFIKRVTQEFRAAGIIKSLCACALRSAVRVALP